MINYSNIYWNKYIYVLEWPKQKKVTYVLRGFFHYDN